jgi:xanthine dehydrogenase molybdenum-binding subunit
MTYGEAVKKSKDRLGAFVMDEYLYDPPSELINHKTGYSNISAAYTFAAHVAEVEVNKKTGLVKVIGFTAAQDVGRAINPFAVEGQIEGAIVQGIGFALMEGYAYKEGKVLNPNFRDYRMPTAKDIPLVENIKTILVETNDPEGPFGAKGVGELSLNPTAAAIANAIYDAVGVRVKDLPILPEKVYEGLKSKN